MAKYARKNGPHWIDVYRVPEDFASIDALNLSLPGGGFLPVDSALQNGAIHNGGDGSAGTYTNPAPPPPALGMPKTLTKKEVRALATRALVSGLSITAAAASARLQAYFDAAKANVGNTNADKNMRWAFAAWQEDTSFDKDEVTQIMLGLQFLAGDRAYIEGAWPTT